MYHMNEVIGNGSKDVAAECAVQRYDRVASITHRTCRMNETHPSLCLTAHGLSRIHELYVCRTRECRDSIDSMIY